MAMRGAHGTRMEVDRMNADLPDEFNGCGNYARRVSER